MATPNYLYAIAINTLFIALRYKQIGQRMMVEGGGRFQCKMPLEWICGCIRPAYIKPNEVVIKEWNLLGLLGNGKSWAEFSFSSWTENIFPWITLNYEDGCDKNDVMYKPMACISRCINLNQYSLI